MKKSRAFLIIPLAFWLVGASRPSSCPREIPEKECVTALSEVFVSETGAPKRVSFRLRDLSRRDGLPIPGFLDQKPVALNPRALSDVRDASDKLLTPPKGAPRSNCPLPVPHVADPQIADRATGGFAGSLPGDSFDSFPYDESWEREFDESPLSTLGSTDSDSLPSGGSTSADPSGSTGSASENRSPASAPGTVAEQSSTSDSPPEPAAGWASQANSSPSSPEFAPFSFQPPMGATSPYDKLVQDLSGNLDIARRAGETEVVNFAIRGREANQNSARDDQRALSDSYSGVTLPELQDRMRQAQSYASGAIADIDSSGSGNAAAELAHYRNLLANARDKAAAAERLIEEMSASGNGTGNSTSSPVFARLQPPKSGETPTSVQTLADLIGMFAPSGASATSTDALVNRVLLFAGLSPEQKAALALKLKLADPLSLRTADGKERKLPVLHNGNLYGGRSASNGCEAFFGAALAPGPRKTHLTTQDFTSIWYYRRNGFFQDQGRIPRKHAELLRRTGSAFEALDVSEKEPLSPGDLLVYHLPWDPSGQIFVVKSYDPVKLTAEVIEATSTAGGLRERELQLSNSPLNSPKRHIRAGLMALRLKQDSSAACGATTRSLVSSGKLIIEEGAKTR